MIAQVSPIIILPGASGRAPGPALFTAGPGDITRFQTIEYPRWRRYVEKDFSVDVFVSNLASQIAAVDPHAPLRILGISIGGHFGYAAALRLQASGRQIAGFCAIDSFMVSSAGPRDGWKTRAIALGVMLLQQKRFGDLMIFGRSRLWRALLRLAGGHAQALLRNSASLTSLVSALAREPTFEEELSMRLLLRETAPWIGSLDENPIALDAPALLIRTSESAGDDVAWRRRCPGIEILQIPGTHQTMFEPENVDTLRDCFLAGTRNWRSASG